MFQTSNAPDRAENREVIIRPDARKQEFLKKLFKVACRVLNVSNASVWF